MFYRGSKLLKSLNSMIIVNVQGPKEKQITWKSWKTAH